MTWHDIYTKHQSLRAEREHSELSTAQSWAAKKKKKDIDLHVNEACWSLKRWVWVSVCEAPSASVSLQLIKVHASIDYSREGKLSLSSSFLLFD